MFGPYRQHAIPFLEIAFRAKRLPVGYVSFAALAEWFDVIGVPFRIERLSADGALAI